MSDDTTFREVLGQFATGVTVVTFPSDPPHGITVNAFASVSLAPPQILIAIDHDTESYRLLEETVDAFAVNILAADQEDLGRHFASIEDAGYDPFAPDRSMTATTGAPIFDGVLGYLDCTVADRLESGDHTIYVGAVEAMETVAEDAPALTFFRGDWGQLADE